MTISVIELALLKGVGFNTLNGSVGVQEMFMRPYSRRACRPGEQSFMDVYNSYKVMVELAPSNSNLFALSVLDRISELRHQEHTAECHAEISAGIMKVIRDRMTKLYKSTHDNAIQLTWSEPGRSKSSFQERIDNWLSTEITELDSIRALYLIRARRREEVQKYAGYVLQWDNHHKHLWSRRVRQFKAISPGVFDLGTAKLMVHTFYKQMPAIAKAYAGIGGLDTYLAVNVKFCLPTDLHDRLSLHDLRVLVHLLLSMAVTLYRINHPKGILNAKALVV